MPKEDNKILKYNHGEKSMRTPFIIYADIDSFLEKMSTCHSNPKKSSTTKTSKYLACGYSLFTRCSINAAKNKKCMKKFCKDLKEHARRIINYEKKKKLIFIISLIKSKRFVIYAKKDFRVIKMIKMHLNYIIK